MSNENQGVQPVRCTLMDCKKHAGIGEYVADKCGPSIKVNKGCSEGAGYMCNGCFGYEPAAKEGPATSVIEPMSLGAAVLTLTGMKNSVSKDSTFIDEIITLLKLQDRQSYSVMEKNRQLTLDRQRLNESVKSARHWIKVLNQAGQQAITEVARRSASYKEALEHANANIATLSDREQYYQQLLQETADLFGKEAYTADDGTVYDTVINSKVPDLVAGLLKRHCKLKRKYEAEMHELQAIKEAIDGAGLL